MTEADFRELVDSFGKVLSLKVMTSDQGRSKGFGFVSYETPEEAQQVSRQMTLNILSAFNFHSWTNSYFAGVLLRAGRCVNDQLWGWFCLPGLNISRGMGGTYLFGLDWVWFFGLAILKRVVLYNVTQLCLRQGQNLSLTGYRITSREKLTGHMRHQSPLDHFPSNLGKMEDISPWSRRDLESHEHHGEILVRSLQSRQDLSKNVAWERFQRVAKKDGILSHIVS